MNEKKLYIFDMGGVVTTTAKIEDEISSLIGIKKDDFFKYCRKGESSLKNFRREKKTYIQSFNDVCEDDDLFELCSNGIINSKEFWQIFYKRSGIEVKTDWWHWIFHPVLNEETVAIIKDLKQRGKRVVCGTNTIDSHYHNHLERGDYSYFDQTYTSCAMGFSKPDPRFWQVILTAEHVKSEECLFIDDRKENVDAAEKLGIESFLFTKASDLSKFLGLTQCK